MYAAKIDLLFESALFLAAVCFSLSLYVLSRGVGNKLNLAYSGLTLCISVWAFAFFVANVLDWRLMESVHILATLLLMVTDMYDAAAMLHAVRPLPEAELERRDALVMEIVNRLGAGLELTRD